MRRFWIALGTLALLLALTLANANHALSLTGELTAGLELAGRLAAQGEWEQARTLTRRAGEEWQAGQFYLHSVMRHGDLDQILRTFHAVEQYLLLEEMDQYSAANAELVTLIRLLAEMEQPTLVNVL